MSALINELQPGFEILWYKVESVLGRGGFGITYLATDTNLGQRVAIKEYLPHDFASRSENSTVQPISESKQDMYHWGLDRFMTEAQTLAKFKHHNIIRVLSVFKHNNTGYMVMEYEQGQPLDQIYERRQKFPQKTLEDIYLPIIDGLKSVHQEGFIHRDIKPSNIYIRSDGSPVLLDFGAAREAIGGKSRALTSMLSVGYAPIEQYNVSTGKQGPWTDIYALSACLHQGITGGKPTESTQRGMALLHSEPDPYAPLSSDPKLQGYSQAFLRSIDHGLMLQIGDRPQSLVEFVDMLKGNIELEDLPTRGVDQPAETDNRTVIRPIKRRQKEPTLPDTHPLTDPVGQAEHVTRINHSSLEHQSVNQADTHNLGSSDTKPSANHKLTWSVYAFALLSLIAAISYFIITDSTQSTGESNKQQSIERLLSEAESFKRTGIIFNAGNDHAINRYQQVLQMDRTHAGATEQLRLIAAQLMSEAETALAQQQFMPANNLLNAVASIDPNYPQLKTTQQALANQIKNERQSRQLQILLDQAEQAMENKHFYQPLEQSAYSTYQKVLTLDPDNSNAAQGLANIAQTMIVDVKTALSNKQFDEVERLLDLTDAIVSDKQLTTPLRAQLKQSTQLSKLIELADQAFAEKRYTQPVNENATSLYREVLKLSPSNDHANTRLDEIAGYFGSRVSSAVRTKDLQSAQSNLARLRKLFPDFNQIPSLSRQVNSLKASLTAAKQSSAQANQVAVGVDQTQDDASVTQDIISRFLQHVEHCDLQKLKQVSQLDPDQENLFNSLFKRYQSIGISIVPQSFTMNSRLRQANAKLQITTLIDHDNREVFTNANWTRIKLSMKKQAKGWSKAKLSHF